MKQLVIGVDVSKATLDICFKPLETCLQISNDVKGFKILYQTVKESITEQTSVMVVIEHTGNYSSRFELFLKGKGIDYCKVAALQIKRAGGIIRGKNDRVDARRIAEYGWLRKDILMADEPYSKEIIRLKQLLSLRAKLVRDRGGYLCRIKELKATSDCSKKDSLIVRQQKLVCMLDLNVKQVENEIDELITSYSHLLSTYELLRSIKGVGRIVAAYMISCTNNFKRFKNARKFNCYAGLAPFKYESGTSLKGRSKVSHLANKEAKALLTLAASCAIRTDRELKKYYQRRVSEGMKKMSCLNIIRSKIVSRIFAVAKRGTPFVDLSLAA